QISDNEQVFDHIIEIYKHSDIILQEFNAVKNFINNEEQTENKENQND
ncbi:12639_t:CDS:1, partial [Cetraspora pellucida]